MLRKVAVGDVMTRNFSAISPQANLLECAKKMVKQRVGCLLLVEKKKLVGLLTQKDILWAITKKPQGDLRTVRAIDVATRKVAVIKPSADIAQAFQKMKRFSFRRLPVLSRGEVVGLLTIKDILRIEPAFYTKAQTLLDVREEEEKIRRVSQTEELESEGLCEECGQLSDLLNVDSRMLCPNCRDE